MFVDHLVETVRINYVVQSVVHNHTFHYSRPAVNIFQWFRLKIVLQSWNLAQSCIWRSIMDVYLPGSVAVARTKIFKMASDSHFEYFFHS